MTPWHTGRLCAFDTETSGISTTEDRIVTAAVVLVGGGLDPVIRKWLIACPVEISEGAEKIHGISTAYSREHGTPPAESLEEIATALAESFTAGRPMVAYNAVFDISLLSHELARYGLPSLDSRCQVAPVLDPLVMDRALDKFRKGSRKLDAACKHYNVTLDEAHEASADALAAARLAWRIGSVYPDVGLADPFDLHAQQIQWHGDWAANYQAFLRGRGDLTAVIDGSWPVAA